MRKDIIVREFLKQEPEKITGNNRDRSHLSFMNLNVNRVVPKVTNNTIKKELNDSAKINMVDLSYGKRNNNKFGNAGNVIYVDGYPTLIAVDGNCAEAITQFCHKVIPSMIGPVVERLKTGAPSEAILKRFLKDLLLEAFKLDEKYYDTGGFNCVFSIAITLKASNGDFKVVGFGPGDVLTVMLNEDNELIMLKPAERHFVDKEAAMQFCEKADNEKHDATPRHTDSIPNLSKSENDNLSDRTLYFDETIVSLEDTEGDNTPPLFLYMLTNGIVDLLPQKRTVRSPDEKNHFVGIALDQKKYDGDPHNFFGILMQQALLKRNTEAKLVDAKELTKTGDDALFIQACMPSSATQKYLASDIGIRGMDLIPQIDESTTTSTAESTSTRKGGLFSRRHTSRRYTPIASTNSRDTTTSSGNEIVMGSIDGNPREDIGLTTGERVNHSKCCCLVS